MCLLYCNPIVHSKHVFVKLINVSCRNFEFLIPDAPELIANFLEGEQDASCKRNAFMMLIHADQVGMLLLAGKHQLCTLDIWIHVYFGFYVISVNLSELLAKNVKVASCQGTHP